MDVRSDGLTTLCVVCLLAAVPGCSQAGQAPGVPRRPASSDGDAGERRDAGSQAADAGLPTTTRMPRLPPADEQVILPFGASADYHFTVSADLGRLDVHFSVDTTLSISEEIDQLQRTLASHVVPRLRERVEDVAFGVSRYEDFPAEPFGAPMAGPGGALRADTPFELLIPITTHEGRLARALSKLDSPLGTGGDSAESSAEALYQIATGAGYSHAGRELVEPFDDDAQDAAGNIGGVGFREGAMHVVVHVTDADTHRPADYATSFPGTHSLDDAIEALRNVEAKVIGVASSSQARKHLEAAAFGTGSVLANVENGGDCPTGIEGDLVPRYQDTCPLVFEVDSDGKGLSDTATDAIVSLLDGIRFTEIGVRIGDDPIGFVGNLEVDLQATEAAAGAADPQVLDKLPKEQPDGLPETFSDVQNRTTLGFKVTLENRTIAPTDHEQGFRVVVVAMGDGLVVAERVIRIMVPAGAVDGGSAGLGNDEDAGR
ncbi:MAG: hypothetical protein OXU20_42390 [Myxococcales bacterium]|nr:hypothetical protein [Myxococcales bacterium]MDD9968265.1 hypothetical protein [Myxococcales bacterium]